MKEVTEGGGQAFAKALAFGLAMTFALLLLFGLQAANPAHAATTFVVNSIDDDPAEGPTNNGVCATATAGECTLRAAIEEANGTTGADKINFAIPGAGPHTISPGSALPQITKPVTINGYSQSGASPATSTTDAVLKIELDGANAGFVSGLLLDGTKGASNSVIRGLVINNFFSFGIYLLGGMGYKIEGNFIGTDPSGTAAEANNNAVTILASNSILGGTTPDKRNLISGNKSHGIQVQGQGNKIQGNLIGTKVNGTEALGNGVPSGGNGMIVNSSSNTIGDSDPSDGLANAANTIAFNKGDGVGISGSGTGNRILSNSIFSNDDPASPGPELGIDLSPPNGVTENDPKDPDTGPNRLQNYPEVTSTLVFPGGPFIGTTTDISGKLNSTPSTRVTKRTFIIQFFSSPEKDPSSFGEGKTFLGQKTVTTNRKGNAEFTVTVNQDLTDQYVTVTATNKGTGDTSEFSRAKLVEEPVIGP